MLKRYLILLPYLLTKVYFDARSATLFLLLPILTVKANSINLNVF